MEKFWVECGYDKYVEHCECAKMQEELPLRAEYQRMRDGFRTWGIDLELVLYDSVLGPFMGGGRSGKDKSIFLRNLYEINEK